jgi:hypothetical protein
MKNNEEVTHLQLRELRGTHWGLWTLGKHTQHTRGTLRISSFGVLRVEKRDAEAKGASHEFLGDSLS